MGKTTGILWTDHTFNPHWGCQRVSPGCDHCYAETWARRTGEELWGAESPRRMFGEKHWAMPIAWNAAAARAGTRARVFCASMGDVFEDRRDLDAVRDRLWPLIECTPWLDWQLLTKRPQNLRGMLPKSWLEAPRRNVWLGATVEDQRRAEERVPLLLDAPAAVRFLSCEPLIEAVDLTFGVPDDSVVPGAQVPAIGMVDWVIVGGESGPGARPFELAWARQIVFDCDHAGTAVFVKQLGSAASDAENGVAGRSLAVGHDGLALVTLRLKDGKGGNEAEWPADLRGWRNFPEARP